MIELILIVAWALGTFFLIDILKWVVSGVISFRMPHHLLIGEVVHRAAKGGFSQRLLWEFSGHHFDYELAPAIRDWLAAQGITAYHFSPTNRDRGHLRFRNAADCVMFKLAWSDIVIGARE